MDIEHFVNILRINTLNKPRRKENQTQIFKYPTNHTFQFSVENNHKELARFVFTEHLSFSFDEKLGFVDHCQNVLNPVARCISHSTRTCAVHNLYRKGKEDLQNSFQSFDGCVSICFDI